MDPSEPQQGSPRKRATKAPSYRLHKPSGQAIVTLNGRMFYLGTFGSPESRVAYNRLLGEWESRGRTLPAAKPAPHALAIRELVESYTQHARLYYRESPGTLANIEHALRPLREEFGSLLAARFGPRLLKSLREQMIRRGWSRPLINARVETVKRAFKWAASEELLPAAVVESLRTVDGLRRGRTHAKEPEPMQPVAWEHVAPVLAQLTPTLRTMVELLWWTGMRTGELVSMKPQEIAREGKVWTYSPPQHKTAWRGKGREIPLGPRAQELLTPFLDRVPKPAPGLPVFSPAHSEAERSLERRRARRTSVQPSQERRQRKALRERVSPPRDAYDANTFAQAVRRGIEAANGALVRSAIVEAALALVPEPAQGRVRARLETLPDRIALLLGGEGAKASKVAELERRRLAQSLQRAAKFANALASVSPRLDGAALLEPVLSAVEQARSKLVPPWRPYALRHAAATRLRREAGLEAARVVLGHSSLQMAEHYAQIDRAKAVEVMARLG